MVTSARVRHGWAEHDGRRLHHLDFGGEGRPVVCVHGVTSCAWVWHHTAAGLGRVVAVDLRGHGDSGWAPADRYRTVDHAGDLRALLVSLGGPADVVGSSWGALVSLAVAAEHPGLVRRLVLVDIEPSFTRPETDIVPPRPARFDGLADAAAEWRAQNPGAPDDLVHLLAAASTRPGPDGGLVPAHDPLFVTRWPFRSENWWDALGAVGAPTLVVRATRSWVRAEICDRMAELLPRSERADVESAHVVPVDTPDALVRTVAPFLARE